MFMNKFLYCFVLILPLASCSSKQWVKPGASQYDTPNARVDYISQSYEKYPVNIQQSFNLGLKSLNKDAPLNSKK